MDMIRNQNWDGPKKWKWGS